MSTKLHCDICNKRITYIPLFKIMRPKLFKIEEWGYKNELDICSECWDKLFRQIREEKK